MLYICCIGEEARNLARAQAHTQAATCAMPSKSFTAYLARRLEPGADPGAHPSHYLLYLHNELCLLP